MTYPTEAHGFLRAGPQLDFYRRLERFLDWYSDVNSASANGRMVALRGAAWRSDRSSERRIA